MSNCWYHWHKKASKQSNTYSTECATPRHTPRVRGHVTLLLVATTPPQGNNPLIVIVMAVYHQTDNIEAHRIVHISSKYIHTTKLLTTYTHNAFPGVIFMYFSLLNSTLSK